MGKLERLYGWAFQLATTEKEIAIALKGIATTEKFENKERGLRGKFIKRGRNRIAYFETFNEYGIITSANRLNHRGKYIA